MEGEGNPPQDLGNPVNPGNDDEGQGDHTSTRRLVRAATPRRVSKHEVHEPSAHDEDLPICEKKVGNYRRILNVLNGSMEDKCVDMVNVRVFVNESSHSSWTMISPVSIIIAFGIQQAGSVS